MQRELVTPRADVQARLESVGFHFHSLDGPYWDESACYRFSSDEIDRLEGATSELHDMTLSAVKSVIERRAEPLRPIRFLLRR
jgi:glutathionylspermidine synthase